MSAVAVLPLAFGGLSLIGLSMQRHARDAGLAKQRPRGLRLLGWAGVLLSLAAAVSGPDWRFALVEWIGLFGVAAALVVLALYRSPRALPWLAAGGILIGIGASLLLSITA